MIIFPAIDLKDGQCVRLQKGEMDKVTVFNESPSNQAATFFSQGFNWLHIVDLNGAFDGKPVNIDAVKSVLNELGGKMSVQLGGGIRDIATIQKWLDAGVARVILGTIALKNSELVKEACKKFPNRIVVGIDGKSGMVAVEGWAETSDISVIDLARKFEDAGVAAIIYTDINRDGLMTGPDLSGTRQLAESVNIPVIASGGMSCTEDIQAVKDIEGSGVAGVIVGRAIYEGKIDIARALQIAA
ncbi:MAG: 1-(5-phosphoribosyl)-5-[(5-phosphoribosylamino)methylideneamino]imidazole-4-carboxamide isomerase [Alphaproteobacteria bacterium CG11_big_fil_rev_8_21_14_0_20_39_49]|nr:MAG: 1-(5-phosphoribosyl)-5-[(5-phosphoribosylamino)methylideneamino]imidazole-4-carboxamide isomerase [Alphaproteobacteria bacterium CG11_big_fil_rev_8_21_14_0_20_39_49]